MPPHPVGHPKPQTLSIRVLISLPLTREPSVQVFEPQRFPSKAFKDRVEGSDEGKWSLLSRALCPELPCICLAKGFCISSIPSRQLH